MLSKNNIKIPFLVINITILFFNCTGSIFSQNNLFYGVVDTLVLQKGDKLVLPDTNIIFPSDTTIYVPSLTKYHIKKNPEIVSENFYKKIEEKYSGKKWSKKMYNLFFRPPAKSYNRYNAINRQSEIPYSKYKGYPIKSISIKKLQVFGQSVYDTNLTIQKWYVKKANQLHINTRTKILKNSLLFKEGQELNPVDISDSERIIRSLPYIRDVKIYVQPDITGKYVNIVVITQDLWTLGLEVEMTSFNTAIIDVYDKNIAGLGHQQTNTFYYDFIDDNYNGYNGYYKIKNQFGAFINTELNYYNRYRNERIKLNISRGFYTPQIKYAGGFTFMQNGLPPVEIVTTDKSIIKSPIKYNYSDFWLARSFNFLNKNLNNIRGSRIIIGGRVINKSFLERPQVTSDLNSSYYNFTHFLGSIGFSKRNYYKGNLIYSYGRTEDIPYGYLINFTLGTRVDDFYEKRYVGINFSSGDFLNNLGYYYTSFASGGFIDKQNIEQGIVDFKFLYFSPLKNVGFYNIRNFIRFNLTYGINRPETQMLDINRYNGIRDFSVDSLWGTNRFKISLETITFSPVHLLGFRFAFFGFADIATLGNTPDFLFNNKYYSGIGLGIRVRNDNLIFRAFEIRFTFFPDMPVDKPQSVFYISNERPTNFNDFYIGAPGFFTYR